MIKDSLTGEKLKKKNSISVKLDKTYYFKNKDNLRIWMAQRRLLRGFFPPSFGPSLPIPPEIHKKTLEKFGRKPSPFIEVVFCGEKMTFKDEAEFKRWVMMEAGEGVFM